ncbi:MAG: hypothetical protein R2880_03980 [Deinococcales bacterium]
MVYQTYQLDSRYITSRRVDVFCPEGKGPFPVLYMHDGQNLFDEDLAYGGEPWAVDKAVVQLGKDTGHGGVMVVGVWNSAKRFAEYMPQKVLQMLSGGRDT